MIWALNSMLSNHIKVASLQVMKTTEAMVSLHSVSCSTTMNWTMGQEWKDSAFGILSPLLTSLLHHPLSKLNQALYVGTLLPELWLVQTIHLVDPCKEVLANHIISPISINNSHFSLFTHCFFRHPWVRAELTGIPSTPYNSSLISSYQLSVFEGL